MWFKNIQIGSKGDSCVFQLLVVVIYGIIMVIDGRREKGILKRTNSCHASLCAIHKDEKVARMLACLLAR